MRSRVLVILFFAALAAACSSHATSSPIVPTPIMPAAVGSPTPAPTPGWSSFTYSGQIWAMATGHDGGMWASMGDGTVSRIDPQGNQTFYALGGSTYPQNGLFTPMLTPNPDGNMYVNEQMPSGSYAIAQVTPGGKVTDFVLPGADYLKSMTTGSDGAIWMVRGYDTFYVARMDTSGNYAAYTNTVAPFLGPIMRGADKNLWCGYDGPGVGVGTIRISVVDGTMTAFPNGVGPLIPGSDGLLWTDVQQHLGQFGFDSIDMNGNAVNYPISGTPAGPLAATAHLLWWARNDKFFAFNTTTHKVSKRISCPSRCGSGFPLVVGPDKRLWSAIGGTMELYTIK